MYREIASYLYIVPECIIDKLLITVNSAQFESVNVDVFWSMQPDKIYKLRRCVMRGGAHHNFDKVKVRFLHNGGEDFFNADIYNSCELQLPRPRVCWYGQTLVEVVGYIDIPPM